MSAIVDAFTRARQHKKAALIGFMTAGFPYPDSTPAMLRAMSDSGADVVEVGVPFSDPMADGPAIQRSSEVALQNGMTLSKSLAAVAAYGASEGAPAVMMGYANSFMNHPGGVGGFASAAAGSGVKGIIVVDLADDERPKWRETLNNQQVELVNLIAPTTPAERLKQLATESQGFVYAISLKGVTGAAQSDIGSTREYLAAARKHAEVPVAAGFGVRTPEHAAEFAEFADGVVVGSRLVEAVESSKGDAETAVGDAVKELAGALVI